jgi:hypothetical protein
MVHEISDGISSDSSPQNKRGITTGTLGIYLISLIGLYFFN